MRYSLFACLAAALCLVGQGSAATIGPDCETCQGGVYTLVYSPVSLDGTDDIYNVFLTIDTSGYTGGGSYINAVAPKLSNDIVSVSLVSAPVSFPAGSSWTTVEGGINANGCSDAGSGFFCTESTGLGASLANDIHSFQWLLTVPDGTLFTDNPFSIKVLYVGANGNKVGDIVSENVPHNGGEIPEPSTIFMSLTGGAFILLARRLRKNTRT